MMWETGVGDTFASLQEGRVGQDGAPSWKLAVTLAELLDGIGVKPSVAGSQIQSLTTFEL
jgi:hypothetical protein